MALNLDKLKKGVQKTKDIRMPDSVKDIAQMSQSALEVIKAKSEDVIAQQKDKIVQQKEAIADAFKTQHSQEVVLSVRDSLRVIYCLMIVDGEVKEEETAKFYEIGQELDPKFASYKAALIEEGTNLMALPAEDDDDYYDNILNQVSIIIHSSTMPKEVGIRGKVLLWDLLAVAYSEGEYSRNEKRLIRFVAKCVGADPATLLEMEHTVRTLLTIEAEENWMKSTNRPYAVVEERVNELIDRKNTIMSGIHALLTD